MAARIISRDKVKRLRPIASLKKLQVETYGYDKPYKLYRIGNKFNIIAKCEKYNDGCGLMVAFEKKDLRATVCGGYGGFDSYGHEFVCPNCRARNWIDTEVFPALLALVRESELIKENKPLMSLERARGVHNRGLENKSRDKEMPQILAIILKDQGLDYHHFDITDCGRGKIRVLVSNKGLLGKIPKRLEDYKIETRVRR